MEVLTQMLLMGILVLVVGDMGELEQTLNPTYIPMLLLVREQQILLQGLLLLMLLVAGVVLGIGLVVAPRPPIVGMGQMEQRQAEHRAVLG